jgi:sugar O-acyltransferase (sialic acid O-acetyltransferase NeuD family)
MLPQYKYIFIGAGGHAKVLLDALLQSGIKVSGVCDPLQPTSGGLSRYQWYPDEKNILQMDRAHTRLLNAIESVGDTSRRCNIYRRFKINGFHFHNIVHPLSSVSELDMEIGEGLQVLAGGVINTGANIGENVLINTHAVVEHDCTIGSHTHIASGAVVCGGCLLGENVHVGAGAVIKQGVTIGSGSLIAAGAAVVGDAAPFSLLTGVPAKVKRILPHE